MIIILLEFAFSEVLTLDKGNFQEVITSGSRLPLFIRLWATWCSHCHELNPIWENLSNIEKYSNNVTIAEIECEANRDICKSFPGEGVPRLFWVDPGNTSIVRYYNERSMEFLELFIQKQLSFPLQLVQEKDILYLDQEEANVSTFLFSMTSNDEKSFSIAKAVTTDLRAQVINFLLRFDDNLSNPSINCYHGHKRKITFNGDFSVDQLKQFIEIHSVPFMANMTPSVLRHFNRINMTIFVVIYYSDEELSNIHDISSIISEELPVVSLNCENNVWFCKYTKSEQFSYVIYNEMNRTYWMFRGQSDTQTIINWKNRVISGELRGIGPSSESPLKLALKNDNDANAKKSAILVGTLIMIISIAFVIFDFAQICDNDDIDTKKID